MGLCSRGFRVPFVNHRRRFQDAEFRPIRCGSARSTLASIFPRRGGKKAVSVKRDVSRGLARVPAFAAWCLPARVCILTKAVWKNPVNMECSRGRKHWIKSGRAGERANRG